MVIPSLVQVAYDYLMGFARCMQEFVAPDVNPHMVGELSSRCEKNEVAHFQLVTLDLLAKLILFFGRMGQIDVKSGK